MNKKRCLCGCNKIVKDGNKYIHGHNPTKHTKIFLYELSKKQKENNVVKRPEVRKKIKNTLKTKYKEGILKPNKGTFKVGHKLRIGMHHTSETKKEMSLKKKGQIAWNKNLKGFNEGEKNGKYTCGIGSYRKRALKKYGKKCQRCGESNMVTIIVHHKDRNRRNNKINNLQVLCLNCHAKEHSKDTKKLRRVK